MNNKQYTAAITGSNKFTVYNAQSMASITTITCKGDIVGSPNISQDIVTVSIKDTQGRMHMSTYRVPSGALICTIAVN
jgi:hypothetical protein